MALNDVRENWHWREPSTAGGPAVIFDIDGVLAIYSPKSGVDATEVAQALAEVKPTGPKDMGKVIALLKPQMAGRADMARVSALVKAKLPAAG